ncbi:MAG: DUF3048 domain-containing protein [Lachnospiraceae bacterium]|nr:DUF3048 domain-containing protein [Lachnospiraceae bacterium]
MRKLRFRILALALAGVFALSLAACKKYEDEPVETEAPVIETETETETEPVDLHPGMERSALTGLWIDEDIAARRPIAVMINNVPAALPQSNITSAQVVYEFPYEGGDTRLMPLYEAWDDFNALGSVRSARFYTMYAAHEWDAILFHFGQPWFAQDFADNTPYIDNVNGMRAVGDTAYHRTTHRSAPHNAYTSGEEIREAIEYMEYSMEWDPWADPPFRFTEDGEPADMTGGTSAVSVETGINGSHSYYEYNEEEGVYYRYQFDRPHVDEQEPYGQVTTVNILIQYVTHDYFQGSEYLLVDSVGSGDGYYITGGKCIPITWSRDSLDTSTAYYTEDGERLLMTPGNTWITFVPNYRAEYTVIE